VADTFSVTFLNDPTDVSGRLERDITNAQDRSRVQGGNRYSVNYQRLWHATLVDVSYTSHDGEVSDIATIREPSNTIKYLSTDVRTLADEQRGGFGTDSEDIRSTRGVNGSVQWTWKQHTFKGGAEFGRYGRFLNSTTVGGAVYTSIAAHLSGVSAGGISTGSYSQSLRFDPFNTSDLGGFITTVNAAPNRAQFYSLFDTNGNGTISDTELAAALLYNSTAGNPNQQVNYYRIAQTVDGAQDFKADGTSMFFQDTFRLQHFTFNLGVRMEQWKHFASEGTKIFTFDWALAPRLSAVYDVLGNGRQKAFAYYGRYYDPIRTNMTAFAGSLSGRVREEQVYANNQWVTYRIRGGSVAQDAFIAPTTKTPYTDDITLGYQVDLGSQVTAEISYTNRKTRDILEDYDHFLYSIDYPGDKTAPGSFYLPPSYFGYTTFPGGELLHRHAEREQARLQRRGVDGAQALRGQVAGHRVVHLQRREGQFEFRLQRRLPGRRALARSKRALPVRAAAGFDRPSVQDGRIVRPAEGLPAWRRLSLELGHHREQDVRVVWPQPAVSRGHGLRVQRRVTALARAGCRGLAYQPVLGPVRSARAVHRACPEGEDRNVRGHLQPVQQPGLHAEPGSAGRLRRHRVWSSDPLPGSAALLHWVPGRLLSLGHSTTHRGRALPVPFFFCLLNRPFRRLTFCPAPVGRLM
jgi:hypothetical protein